MPPAPVPPATTPTDLSAPPAAAPIAAAVEAPPAPAVPPAPRTQPAPPALHLPVDLRGDASPRTPRVPPLRLELPAAVAAPAARPVSVAAFVAAELRSIPAQWIEEAGGGRGAAVAVAAAPTPATRPVAAARVHLVAVPEPEPEEAAEPPSGWPLAPAAIIRPCPMPDGARLFGPLHSSYVDGPALLRELGGRGHSGALVTAGGGRAQAAVLHRGAVVALLATGRSGTRRLESLRLPLAGQHEEHELAVPVYRPEVAVALGQMVNLVARFRRMHASFVRLPALLEHLAERRVTGGVRISTGSDVGVLLLSEGRVLGAYSARHPALEDVELVARLCAAGDAEIDVHAAPAEAPPPAVAVARLLG